MSTPAPSAVPTASGPTHRPLNAGPPCAHPPHRGHEPDAVAEPTPAPTPCSSSAVAAAESARPSPVAHVYRHALECIFAFSDANTLAAALHVSKEWLAAVGSMGALALKVRARTALIESVAASSASRHVADLCVLSHARMSADAVGSMSRMMPHLRRLDCSFPRPLGAEPVPFPPALRALQLVTFNSSTSVADINAAIEGAGRLEQPEILELRVKLMDPLISFAPLAALPLLRRLTITAADGAELGDAQVDQLRALPRLQHLVFPSSTSVLRRLLAQPHDLQWQQISLPSVLSDDDAALLPQLPSLTAVHVDAEYLCNFGFLQRLPSLSSVHCSSVHDVPDAELADRLVAALQHCANVTDLRLSDSRCLSADHLTELLPRLPRLQSLTLCGLHIDLLSFLTQPPLTGQLSALRLSRCRELPLAELRHVHALRGLRMLDIKSSFDQRMHADCDALTALRLPSAALPLLESFSYCL